MEENVYRCESCGGIMEFDASSQALKCPNCDTVVQIQHDDKAVEEHTLTSLAVNTYSVQEKQSTTLQCSGCGATIEMDGDSTSALCPYCGSSYVLADKQVEAIIPDGVIPFKIDKNEVKEVFRKWIKKRYFAPSNLKQLYQTGNIQGRYIPFWTFDADCHATYRGMGGRNRTVSYKDSEGNTKTRVVTDWYPTSGRVDHFFDDVLVRGTEKVKASLLEGIDSYNTREVLSYSPEYFSGYLSESYTVDLKTAHQDAVSEMRNELHSMAVADIRRRYDKARDVRLDIRYDRETFKHIIVPMYTTSYSYNNKNYTVLINGQNGDIKGEYPKSVVKIAALVIAILAVLITIFVLSNKAEASSAADDETDKYCVCEEYIENQILIEDTDIV